MKNIQKWLRENGLEYDQTTYGNPYYFNDGFRVPALTIGFYYDNKGNNWQKQADLKKYMKRKKAYICKASRFGAGIYYTIMTVFDERRLIEHENKVQTAVSAYWKAEHARRMQAASQA